MSKHAYLISLLSQIDNNSFNYDKSKHISNIFENLYLGSKFSTQKDIIYENNISTIISIGCRPLENSYQNVNCYYYDIQDNGSKSNVEVFFTKIIPEIHQIINNCLKQNMAVLVHCQAGMSRSATAIIMWLIKYQQMNYENAFLYVKQKRPVISPNLCFIDYMKTIQL